MTREQLEHIIRAAADISSDDEIVIIGSQAILGQFPAAPAQLRVSVDADVFPRNHPDRAELIDGTIGELSPFHATYGYYAHGVGESTAILPVGWRDRLIAVKNANTRGATGWCRAPTQISISRPAPYQVSRLQLPSGFVVFRCPARKSNGPRTRAGDFAASRSCTSRSGTRSPTGG